MSRRRPAPPRSGAAARTPRAAEPVDGRRRGEDVGAPMYTAGMPARPARRGTRALAVRPRRSPRCRPPHRAAVVRRPTAQQRCHVVGQVRAMCSRGRSLWMCRVRRCRTSRTSRPRQPEGVPDRCPGQRDAGGSAWMRTSPRYLVARAAPRSTTWTPLDEPAVAAAVDVEGLALAWRRHAPWVRRDVAAPEGVDRLLGVAMSTTDAWPTNASYEHLPLDGVGVLELVDHHESHRWPRIRSRTPPRDVARAAARRVSRSS